jgi:hypothetical protein
MTGIIRDLPAKVRDPVPSEKTITGGEENFKDI